VAALILSRPEFGRARVRLAISCPVLVISAGGPDEPHRHRAASAGQHRLGQHVTWLHLEDQTVPAGPRNGGAENARRRLFDEMGRWLGAYMYGGIRDQLL
jgi:hypothetical protein